ncbi:hypothetical protein [Pseudoflavonifractor phocaeensis]|uniref:hypothetical protein n=1 Tax=Pseudoflavonifractor phocaeensis TaxID=1870988 RepID=UPI0019596E99|nr:hypothetical protein [Pseudoflavonifractor phocaeensis]MBM6722327.1 hypothetical protein [Pseudoflavonifractor phocaeensis]
MQPAHRLFILDENIKNNWFNVLCEMHGGSKHTKIYILNDKYAQQFKEFKDKKEAIMDSAFIITEYSKSGMAVEQANFYPNLNIYYELCIIDKKLCDYIKAYRWRPEPQETGYWRNNKLKNNYKLHQYVVCDLAGIDYLKKGFDIHHSNFYTFDNRLDNLYIMTSRAHGKIDESHIILREEIRSDNDMLNFIKEIILK